VYVLGYFIENLRRCGTAFDLRPGREVTQVVEHAQVVRVRL